MQMGSLQVVKKEEWLQSVRSQEYADLYTYKENALKNKYMKSEWVRNWEEQELQNKHG